ncbi:hypothetical protein RN001_008719 [Aquatica leii]|uniref:Uncharacterized protein n=1 Tax=Aquatica leii TaxID=1421715 RepID=A0AAN7SPC6_9COLE|nr:hypothetical protein RN001_008719 [Aquatica leii]
MYEESSPLNISVDSFSARARKEEEEEKVEKIINLEESNYFGSFQNVDKTEFNTCNKDFVKTDYYVKENLPPVPCCSPISEKSSVSEGANLNRKKSPLVTLIAVEKKLNNEKQIYSDISTVDENENSVVKFDKNVKEYFDNKRHDNQWEPAECKLYAEIPEFANTFVSEIIDSSIGSIEKQRYLFSNDQSQDTDSLVSHSDSIGADWPRICDFTIELGKTSIDEYMNTWQYAENWLYHLSFLIVESDDYGDYYIYEAKWSIPTNSYPIPQVTASIFFTIEISKLKPPACFVDVSYMYEGSRLVYYPYKMSFNENFLYDILNVKLEFIMYEDSSPLSVSVDSFCTRARKEEVEEKGENIINLRESNYFDSFENVDETEILIYNEDFANTDYYVANNLPPTPCCSPVSGNSSVFECQCLNIKKLATFTGVKQELNNEEQIFSDVSTVGENETSVVKFDNNVKEYFDNRRLDNKWEPADCKLYAEIPEFANTFVSEIIDNSIDLIEKGRYLFLNDQSQDTDSLVSHSDSIGADWPRICDFTIELGKTSIDEYMNMWQHAKNWLYCLTFLIVQSDDYGDYYIYEAKWSIPTNSYSIPQVTASIFFTIEVSKLKPPACFVDVRTLFC